MGFPKWPITIILPPGRWGSLNLKELWLYHDLLFEFVRRDITVRYKQSLIGIGWVILQPLLLMLVFTVIFGKLAGFSSDGSPYPIFTFSALLPWTYFSRSLNSVSGSLVGSVSLITKVYFPRIIIPISKIFVGLVDFAISLIILAFLMLWYRIEILATVLVLPLFLGLAALTALGFGLWLSALNVKYRDVGLAVPYFLQVWLFASPVAYSINLIPKNWQWLYEINPMVGVINGFRWALLGQSTPDFSSLIIASLIATFVFASGLIYFCKSENAFADVI